jgi:HD superfamily phosphohydrolase YqeK
MNETERITKYIDFMSESTEVIDVKDLMSLGFFTQPASTKYHGAYTGGLFDHSLETANALVKLTERLNLKWERSDSPYIVGMYHDLCKCGEYVEINSYDEIAPVGKKYKHNPNIIIPGHGDKSVIITQKYIKLTDEEIACIR